MNLLMITKFYPFGSGEAFIENEIQVLAQYYDHIHIVACEKPKGTQVRALPKNVTAEGIEAVGVFGKGADVVGGLRYIVKKSPEATMEWKCAKTIKQKLFLGYFEQKAHRIFEKIRNSDEASDLAKEEYCIYSYWFFVTARVALLFHEQYPAKYLFTRAHRYDLYAEKNSVGYLPYRTYFLQKFDYIFPCSYDGERYLKERFPMYQKKVKCQLLGTIDHGICEPSSDGIFRIVSCSRLEAVKRIQLLVKALAVLDTPNYKIQWTHIGEGKERSLIEKEIQKLKYIKCVFAGNLPNKAVMKYYAENPVDLFVNVSSSEGLPVSIMEAISFGIPTIATDVGGTKEIVLDNITGMLLPENPKPEEISDEITKFMCSSQSEAKQLRLLCRQYWEKHFQAKQNYCRMYDYLTRND